MSDVIELTGEEHKMDDAQLSPDDTLSSHEKCVQVQENEQTQTTVKNDEAAGTETVTKPTLEDSIKEQQDLDQDLPGLDASPSQLSCDDGIGVGLSQDENTDLDVDKSTVEKEKDTDTSTFEQETNHLKLEQEPEHLQEKIRQLEQQVKKGLDEAAQHQERADSAVAELVDAKKGVESMKDEVEEANGKVSELADRVQKQRGVIDSLKSGILHIDPKKGRVFLRVHIAAMESVLFDDHVSQEEDCSSPAPKIEEDFSHLPVSPPRPSAESTTNTTSQKSVNAKATATAAQNEISELSNDNFEEVVRSEQKSLSELMSGRARAQASRSVSLKQFSEKDLPTGTLSQDLILEKAMKKKAESQKTFSEKEFPMGTLSQDLILEEAMKKKATKKGLGGFFSL
jgi:hypothetical protein